MGNITFFRIKKILAFASLLALPFLYQNCSKESAFSSASSLTTQCINKLQSLNLTKLIKTNQLNCEDARHYNCEVRFFNPDTEEIFNEDLTCLINDSSFCAQTKNRYFNTAKAREIEGSTAADFEFGGDYNRIEAHCSYFNSSSEHSLIKIDSDTAIDALEKVKTKCLEAQLGDS